jgi:hypothetical protein
MFPPASTRVGRPGWLSAEPEPHDSSRSLLVLERAAASCGGGCACLTCSDAPGRAFVAEDSGRSCNTVAAASFLEELAVLGPPGSVTELNRLAPMWLAKRVNGRVHGTTGEVPAERLAIERRFLSPLPRRCYDTAYAEPRRVHLAVPLIHWKGVRYSVTPGAIGQKVACREEVDSGELSITWAGLDVGRHRIAPPGSPDVWDPSTARRQKPRRSVAPAGAAPRHHPSARAPPGRPLRLLRRGGPRPRQPLRDAVMTGVYG